MRMTAIATAALLALALPCAALDLPASGFQRKSCGAAQGPFWNLWSDGSVSQWVRVAPPGRLRFEIEAFGSEAAGAWPRMRVTADLAPLTEVVVDSAAPREFVFTADIDPGVRLLALHFTNDYYNPDRSEDRNLHLGRIRVLPAGDGGAVEACGPPDWRAEADASIEAHRKGDWTLRILDAGGAPRRGVRIHAALVRHAFPFGCAISSGFVSGRWSDAECDAYARRFAEFFNHAVHENALKWAQTNRQGPEADFRAADAILAWCEERDISMRGHCILWADERRVPGWAKALENDALREAVLERIDEVLARYAGRIADFDLNNEMIHVDTFSRRLGAPFRVEMFRRGHDAAPDVPLYVNDFAILTGAHLERYVEHIAGLLDAGAPVGGVGCQGHFSGRTPPPLTVRMALDRLARFGLPIKITEFDVDTGDEEAQARDLEDFYRVCFAHPAVAGILQWGFWEGAHWRPRGALFRRDWSEKPAGTAYRRLIRETWTTRVSGRTDADGAFEFRGFFGTYAVEVETEAGGVRREVALPRDGAGETVEVRIP